MISRRSFVGVTLNILAAPLAIEAQQAEKVWRIGWLSTGPHPFLAAFRDGLRDAGYVERRNLVIEKRDGSAERLPELAAQLLRSGVDVMLTSGGPAATAAREATTSVPIVSVSADPVAFGNVASLARPGGNVTGIAILSTELAPKWLQLTREALGKLTGSIAVLANPGATDAQVTAIQEATRTLGISLTVFNIRGVADFEPSFAQAAEEHAAAVIGLSSAFFGGHYKRIVTLAAKYHLPAMYEHRGFADAGGLMSYGPNLTEVFRRAAGYVDKILKGVRPADLPVEQPTKYELVINLKTAKALGLTIPRSLLLRADEVIR